MPLVNHQTKAHRAILAHLTNGQWMSLVDLAEALKLDNTYVRKLCWQLVSWHKLDMEQRLFATAQGHKMPANWYKLGTGQVSKLRQRKAKREIDYTKPIREEAYDPPQKQPQHGGRVVHLTDSRRWEWGGQAVKLGGSREYSMEVMW